MHHHIQQHVRLGLQYKARGFYVLFRISKTVYCRYLEEQEFDNRYINLLETKQSTMVQHKKK